MATYVAKSPRFAESCFNHRWVEPSGACADNDLSIERLHFVCHGRSPCPITSKGLVSLVEPLIENSGHEQLNLLASNASIQDLS